MADTPNIQSSDSYDEQLSLLLRIPTEQLTQASFSQISAWERNFDVQKNYNGRNMLLSWLITSGAIKQYRKKFSIKIDSLGLYINIPEGAKDGIHAHLPFREITTTTLQGLTRHSLMSADDIIEIRSQLGLARASIDTIQADAKAYVTQILDLEQISSICQELHMDPALISQNPSIFFESDQNNLTHAILTGKHIPIQLLLSYLQTDVPTQRSRVMHLLALADEIGKKISASHAQESPYGFATAKASKIKYGQRKSLLQDPKYYEISKILNTIINICDLTADEKNNWCVYWTPWQNDESTFNAGASISFFYNKQVIDLPLTPDRHLVGIGKNQRGKQLLQGAKKLTTPAYAILDSAIRSYKYFLGVAQTIRDNYRESGTKNPDLDDSLGTLEDILYSEIPGWDFPLPNFYTQEDGYAIEEIEKYLNFGETQYSTLLMRMQTENSFEPYVVPITLGNEYMSQCASSGRDAYDPSLMQSNTNFDCIEIPNSNTGGLFHAATRLGLMRGKPLISVIGGCKNLDQDMSQFGQTIVNIACQHAANLCVPGTQSGIGNVFGKLRVDYENANPKLKREHKMQMYGIIPAESAYYEQNQSINEEYRPYAISVPSILMRGTDGWSTSGSHSYFKKMGIFWDHLRIDTEQTQQTPTQHVVIVGNGGAFTIAELNAGLKKGAHPLFIEHTGRFADLAIQILANLANIGSTKEEIEQWIRHQITIMPDNKQLLKDAENLRWWEEMHTFIALAKRKLANDTYSTNLLELQAKVDAIIMMT